MAEDRFPYEKSRWHSNEPEKQLEWFEALERTGATAVRIRLNHHDGGSAGSIAIGTAISMTNGFAEEWLAWHDRQKSEREARFRERQIFWTRWAAFAASIAALAAVIGWIITVTLRG